MIKTKLISLATMSAFAVGVLAPLSSVGAAEVTTATGDTEARFTLTNSDQLVLEQAPNMDFGSTTIYGLRTSAQTLDYKTGWDTTRNARTEVTAENPIGSVGLRINDYRDPTKHGSQWQLHAQMETTFTADNATSIASDGISNLAFSSGEKMGDTINADNNLIANEASGIANTTVNPMETTNLNLLKTPGLISSDIGKTYSTDITWTLSDSVTP